MDYPNTSNRHELAKMVDIINAQSEEIAELKRKVAEHTDMLGEAERRFQELYDLLDKSGGCGGCGGH